MGETLETVIVAAGILYEIVGPIAAKLALYLSGACTDKLEELVPQAEGEDEVSVLCERIRTIREELPERILDLEAEDAYTEAAMNQREALFPRRRGLWRGR